jgi:hypothetical protein
MEGNCEVQKVEPLNNGYSAWSSEENCSQATHIYTHCCIDVSDGHN